MEFILKKLIIKNFKGIRERTEVFDDTLTRIEGKNASCKTTLMDAFFWLFNDTDSELKSNPPIFPLGIAECTPEVEAEFSVDGKTNRLRKMQTRKVTESGGLRKVALSNTFLFNDVPMAQRDIAKKFDELGVDFSRFTVLSHTSAFLSLKKDDQRKILFEMANIYSDHDIAVRLGDDVKEAAKELENYTFEEVKAVANATLKRINETYGKKGEIWQAKIEGLSMSVIQYDFAELELLKNDYNDKLSGISEKHKANLETEKQLGILHDKEMNLQFELSGLKNSLQATQQATLKGLKEDLDSKKAVFERKKAYFHELETVNESQNRKLEFAKRELATAKSLLDITEHSQFDEESTLCPTCGQSLPEADIQGLKAKFESDKAEKIKRYTGEMEEAETLISGYEKNLVTNANDMVAAKTEGKTAQDAYLEAKAKYESYEIVPDEPTDEIKAKEQELADIKSKIEDLKKSFIPNLDFEEANTRESLKGVELKLNQAHTNALIDEKISELRRQQAIFEQDRANAERLLFQLDLIQKEKNTLLVDEINAHFDLVKFKLFDFLKNGSYTDVVIPMVGDKELNSALNTAMQVRAKIDICNGLQKFYDQHFTLWLDGAECLDTENQKSLTTDTQMILLIVKD